MNKYSVQNIAGIMIVLILFIGCLTAAFFLTSFLYTTIEIFPSALVVQVINSLLGLMIGAILIKIAARFDRPTKGLFDSIIHAQKKISSGNYEVELDTNGKELGPFGELVESVNQMAIELSKMEKMRKEFIANVSHEIQSPLTSIHGFAQTLRNSQLSPENRIHYLDIIESESVRLSKMSDSLLRLASLEADTMKFEPEIYRLDKQLRSIILACEPQWSDKNMNMDIMLEELEIRADKDMMGQIWINLIHNSIKFTPKGGNMSIAIRQDGEDIVGVISDTGIGISQEDQIYIFERFFKTDRSRKPANQGSGLGLSIVKKMVDMHKGKITVESKLGLGSTFTVTLPNKN
ncbi:sensor histidine kinase [Shimazuella kribbensis]|uniref:sensor histidine kinase n=1 Tax=Shimazuella kribbensis TaxID=139808 RepID=UPI00056958DE|nr:HAMP domain-containing sensor histidine kinase [Shimazuella kribbensis]